MVRPNLFEYATSELSQDAILCWLAAWAAPEAAEEDEALHSLGVQFVNLLFEAHGQKAPSISSLKAETQHQNIDILLQINATYAVCIEDKAGSVEHSDQLTRYLETLEEEGFARENIIPIYVQTYEQCSYQAVREQGYAPISRGALLELLRPYAESPIANVIVRDFHEHLMAIDQEFESFKTQSPSEWKRVSRTWQGLFCKLHETLADGEWRYVPNQTGGFQAYYWHFRETPWGRAYLQLEEEALCFKIEVEEKEGWSKRRDQWRALVLEGADTLGLSLGRPRRLGVGKTMTVAVATDGYLRTDSRGRLDLDATIQVLRQAEAVHERLVGEAWDKAAQTPI